jgi:hypothetical protein
VLPLLLLVVLLPMLLLWSSQIRQYLLTPPAVGLGRLSSLQQSWRRACDSSWQWQQHQWQQQ